MFKQIVLGFGLGLMLFSHVQSETVESVMTWRVAPSFAIAAPAGYVPGAGILFGALAANVSAAGIHGGTGLGVGFGDAIDGIGGSVAVILGGASSPLIHTSTLSLSVGHTFKETLLGISAGVSDISLSNTKVMSSYYISCSQYFSLSMPLFLTLGVGNNLYAHANRIPEKLGVFASSALYFSEDTSAILDYTSGILSLGFSHVPFQGQPIVWDINASGFFQEHLDNNVWLNTSISMMWSL